MIQQIKSRKLELPKIWLIENEEDYKQLPRGLPFVIGSKKDLPFITLFLEFQVLYKSCLKTNIPIKWLECLSRLGYKQNRTYQLHSGGNYDFGSAGNYPLAIDDFVTDNYFVNFDKLSELKIFPVWLEDLKTAIETNIIDEVIFDPTAFNKQLGMNIGAAGLKHNLKNLLILDISSSMPRSVVMTITNLAKLMSKKFYADVILTGRQSIFIDYEKVQDADIPELTKKHGGGNEGVMFRAIVKESKQYNTVISFGDNDCPGDIPENECNFKVETLYSLHTEGNSTKNITGYSRCFKPKTKHIIQDWINTISN